MGLWPTPENTVDWKPSPQWMDPDWPLDLVPDVVDELGRRWTTEGWLIVLEDRLSRIDRYFNPPYFHRLRAAIENIKAQLEQERIARMKRGPRTRNPDGTGLIGTDSAVQ